jgi:hypothetical protein
MRRHVAQGTAVYDFSSQEIKMKRCLSIVFCLAFLSLGLAGNAIADPVNLVQNGDFLANLDNWTVTPASTNTSEDFGITTVFPLTGYTNSVLFGSYPNYDQISQVLTTVPGQIYTFSFYLNMNPNGGYQDPASNPMSFIAEWTGTTTTVVFNSDSVAYDTSVNGAGWLQYTFTETAQTSSDYITFEGFNTPDQFQLADISVTVVPEPSTILIYGTGLLVLAGMRRWIRRS